MPWEVLISVTRSHYSPYAWIVYSLPSCLIVNPYNIIVLYCLILLPTLYILTGYEPGDSLLIWSHNRSISSDLYVKYDPAKLSRPAVWQATIHTSTKTRESPIQEVWIASGLQLIAVVEPARVIGSISTQKFLPSGKAFFHLRTNTLRQDQLEQAHIYLGTYNYQVVFACLLATPLTEFPQQLSLICTPHRSWISASLLLISLIISLVNSYSFIGKGSFGTDICKIWVSLHEEWPAGSEKSCICR